MTSPPTQPRSQSPQLRKWLLYLPAGQEASVSSPHPSLLPSLQAVAKPLLVHFLQVSAPAGGGELCGPLSQSPIGSELREGGVMSFSGISVFPAHCWPGTRRPYLYLSSRRLPSSHRCWSVLPDFLSAQYKGDVKSQNVAASLRIISFRCAGPLGASYSAAGLSLG